ncbi:MAG: hypothetical protein ACYC4Q_10710 [Victivallaceae bacterium]
MAVCAERESLALIVASTTWRGNSIPQFNKFFTLKNLQTALIIKDAAENENISKELLFGCVADSHSICPSSYAVI